MTDIILNRPAIEAISQSLLGVYPDEGCGALIGRNVSAGTIQIDRSIPISNNAPRGKSDRYELDAFEYARLEDGLRLAGNLERIVGFFHGHPNAIAEPSQVDLEAARGLFDVAREYYIYAIQSISIQGAGELSFWRLNSQRTRFAKLVVTPSE